jgi:hypothetical protein
MFRVEGLLTLKRSPFQDQLHQSWAFLEKQLPVEVIQLELWPLQSGTYWGPVS